MKFKIRKGDIVEVISGSADDKGKRGEVIRVDPDENRVVIQGVNLITKHQRQVQAQNRTVNPGIVKFEAPMSLSNVKLVCPKCNKPARVGLVRNGDKTQRVCKECDAILDD